MGRFRTGAVLVAAALAVAAGGPAPQRPADLLLLDARVLDGSGNPWFAADVAVVDGRIAAIGRLEGAAAREVVDLDGRYLAPGFIDIHSHADDGSARVGEATMRTDDPGRKAAPNLVSQGVTTVVVNQDGRSPWPIADQRALFEAQGVGPNVMLMVGHGTVRREVMGDDFRRTATADEVARMRALVRQAIEEGAVGLSAGLEYVPGRWSDVDEVAALVGELAAVEGVYISHQRSEGADPMWFWPSRDDPGAPTLIDAILETVEIGRRTGVRVVASHIKAKGAHYWGSSGAAIQLIERARAEGVPVYADQYPYVTSGSDGNTVLLPRWALFDPEAPSRDEAPPPGEVLLEHLADPASEAAVRRDTAHEIRRRGGADRVVIFDYPDGSLVGRSLAEVAAARGIDPVEMAIRLQFEGDPERPGGGRLRGFSMSEADAEAYARQTWVATASDAGLALPDDGPVHARFYGTFPRKIARYVRQLGTISLEHAVRSQTSLPAQIMGLHDRGTIREGARADLVVFDLDTLQDRATFVDPHQHAAGIEHVLVNGTFVVREGEILYALPGEVLTRAR